MLHISHRGGSRENLENTLEAFEFARKYTDMIECDVFMSKDKKVVVYHDNNMMRMNGVNKRLEEQNYDKLPDFVDEFPMDFGHKFIYKTKNGSNPKLRRFCLLEELF